MSYLLEALKRLEEQRQHPEKSDLLTVQGRDLGEVKRKAAWPYILSAALLINAAVVVWLLGPWRTSPHRVSSRPGAASARNIQSPAANRPIAAEPPVNTGNRSVESIDDPRNQSPPPKPLRLPTQPPTEAANSTTGAVKKNQVKSLATGLPDRIAETPSSPKPVVLTTPSGEGRTTGIGQAPASKNEALELRLSLHSYSTDAKARLVRIDERTVREGETLTTGVIVEEITPDGVIINNRGSRIHLKVQN